MSKEGSEEILIHFRSSEELEVWLEENGTTSKELWIEIYKKNTKVKSISWAEIVDTVLCFGWIDSQRLTIDDNRYKQRITPRRARSQWSKINTEKAEKIIAEGKMREAGLLEVERAKTDGRWENAYDAPSKAKPSKEFLRALRKNNLEKTFKSLKASERYHMLYRIQTARREETKEKRIREFCDQLKSRSKE